MNPARGTEVSLAKALSNDGYNQTYIIQSASRADDTSNNREVFFRCGNWCYKGKVQFNELDVSIKNLTLLVSTLQKQQTSLRFDCNAAELPTSSTYHEPLVFFNDAVEFISSELASNKTQKELTRMANIFPWIDSDKSDDETPKTYFEFMLTHEPAYMKKIRLIASKTYTRGLVIVSIYYEGAIYFVVLPGEGDQGLLDVRFPDVCSHGQGCLVSFYGTIDTAESTTGSGHGQRNLHRLDQDKETAESSGAGPGTGAGGNGAKSNYEEYGSKKGTHDGANDTKSGPNSKNNNQLLDNSHRADSKTDNVEDDEDKLFHSLFKPLYKKLVLWQSFGGPGMMSIEELNRARKEPLKVNTADFSSDSYQQTYIILREPNRDGNAEVATGRSACSESDYDTSLTSSASYRDVLFRFGSWCYTGRIRLVESLIELQDIPIMIPVLRAQQSALEFAYEVTEVPLNSPYAEPMEYVYRTIIPNVMDVMSNSEVALQNLIFRLTQMGLDHSVREWLDSSDDSNAGDSFFEFSLAAGHESLEPLKDIEVIASKMYLSGGLCAVCIIHQNTVYVSLTSLGAGDNQPLLDSRFPDVGGKGRGYILNSTPDGTEQWPALRKVSIWQTATALQREFMARSSSTRTGITDSAAQPKRKWPAMIKDRTKAEENSSNNNDTTDTVTDDTASVPVDESKGHKIDVSAAADAVAAVVLSSSSSSLTAGDKVPHDASFEASSASKEVFSALGDSTHTDTADSSADGNNPWLTQKAPGLLMKGNSLAMKGHHLPPLAAVAKSLAILNKDGDNIAWDKLTGEPLMSVGKSKKK